VQASLKGYTEHILVASSRPASSWPKRVESFAPTAAEDDEERLAADGATALAHMAHAAAALKPQAKSTLTLLDVTEDSAFADGDMILLSTTEPPLLLRNTHAPSSSSTWKPKKTTAASPSAPAVRALSLNNGQPLPTSTANTHSLLKFALAARGASLAPEGSSHEAGSPPLRSPFISDDAVSSSSQQQPSGEVNILALVCCHRERDVRCGDRGPPIVKAIRTWAAAAANQPSSASTLSSASNNIAAEDVKAGPRVNLHVLPCSHVGGHEFAANVLLFGWTTRRAGDDVALQSNGVANDWFGLVLPQHVPQVLEAYTRFVRDRNMSHDVPSHELHRQLLLQKLDPIAASDAAALSCATCSAPADGSSSVAAGGDAPFVPTHLAQIWRGSMGMNKEGMRELLRSVPKIDGQ
jgi:hypothetical protein